MKKTAFAILGLVATLSASASCIGSGSFQTCTDSSGNTYHVNRFGNTTMMNGYSANGTTWNQTSQQLGNTTYHNGNAANGNSWNGSTSSYGNTQVHRGVNSQGQYYQRTCINGICN